MRIQVIKSNGKTLGEFCSIKDAARVLRVPPAAVRYSVAYTQAIRSKDEQTVKLGWLKFYEMDETKKGSC